MTLDEVVESVAALALNPSVEAAVPGLEPPPVGRAQITPRQQDILRLVCAGLTNREIAAALAVSVATVERHLANVYERIGAGGRAEATRYAVRTGLVSPSWPSN